MCCRWRRVYGTVFQVVLPTDRQQQLLLQVQQQVAAGLFRHYALHRQSGVYPCVLLYAALGSQGVSV